MHTVNHSFAARVRSFVSVALLGGFASFALSGCTSEDVLTVKHNDARKANGLPALWRDSGAMEVWAKRHSQEMAAKGALFHTSPLTNYSWPAGWKILGENVGVVGNDDMDAMFNAFMNSPAHRANILNRAFTHFAIGCAKDGAGRTWCTVGFEG